MVVGVAAAALGWFSDKTEHHQYWWANLLINGFFFFAIALGALFFYALQYAAEVAWSAQLKRIFEGIFSYLPLGFGIVAAIILIGQFHGHHLYHWMDPKIYDTASDHYDAIIAGKRAFFSPAFFWGRVIVYGAVFIGFVRYFKKWSLKEDEVGGTEIHYRMYRRSAVFLVLFAVFSSTMAWDWLMSIDTHWYSTLYGWYIFSGMWTTSMIAATLLVIWLKKLGYLTTVNDSHIHDLGKWVFAISMLWSYLWFCQYMLIWYSNIPEEVTYFMERYEHYMTGMWTIFAVNFAVPFYVLISRDAKRNSKLLARACVVILIAHFFDLYMAVVPGTTHGHVMWGFGEAHHITFAWWFEIGMFLGFAGLFVYIVLNALTKSRLIPAKHPFLSESEHHSI
ncbi:MAG: quinol:cytochrome C oxidoreductase [Crocinitomicaceae bacterium]|nr:quinol:cytochrome C oxidoreductase [Crocinitomicaceae bacterium]